ncbi:MAG: hypothetical protein LAO55_06340 [Acidobacteriia bacterium]|nr:hypothetical protein [Terriglobia bacterium]
MFARDSFSSNSSWGPVSNNKRFELTRPALALDPVVRQGWITIPAGAVIRTLADPNGDGDQMIDVIWDGRMLAMLAIEVATGGREIIG